MQALPCNSLDTVCAHPNHLYIFNFSSASLNIQDNSLDCMFFSSSEPVDISWAQVLDPNSGWEGESSLPHDPVLKSSMSTGVEVWVAAHPCETVRLKSHQQRVVKSWHTPDWLQFHLDKVGCAPNFAHWNGAVDILGLIALEPGNVVDELTPMTSEEKLLCEWPAQHPCSWRRRAEEIVRNARTS